VTQTIDEERERLVQRAYEIYLDRGGVEGISEDDWLQAEKELRAARPGKYPALIVLPG
jgi:hypothetical protein